MIRPSETFSPKWRNVLFQQAGSKKSLVEVILEVNVEEKIRAASS